MAEIVKRQVEKLSTEIEVWEEIVDRYPRLIAMLAYATYETRPHGALAQDTKVILPRSRFSSHLLEGKHHIPGVKLAISTTIGTNWGQDIDYVEDGAIDRIKNPMQFLAVDFECQNSQANLTRIVDVLDQDYKFVDWYLFDSGNGFHLIVDGPIPVQHVPLHYGRMVSSFALKGGGYLSHLYKGFGEDLQKYNLMPSKLMPICTDILRTFVHREDKVGKGHVFIIDLRHVAHSILEMLDGLPSGFLRVSDKYGSQPVLIARHTYDEGIVIFSAENYPFGNTTLALEGL